MTVSRNNGDYPPAQKEWPVAAKVILHPEFLALLKQVEASEHVHAVVVTCRLASFW